MNLPAELAQLPLLVLPLEDLRQVCSTNSTYRGLCSDKYFWREKFRREGIPLLLEGEDFTSWVDIYRQSRFAWDYTQAFFQSFYDNLPAIKGDQVNLTLFNLASINNPSILYKGEYELSNVTHYLTRAWTSSRRDLGLELINESNAANTISIYSRDFHTTRDPRITRDAYTRQKNFLSKFFIKGGPNYIYRGGLVFYRPDKSFRIFLVIELPGEVVRGYDYKISLEEAKSLIYELTFYGFAPVPALTTF